MFRNSKALILLLCILLLSELTNSQSSNKSYLTYIDTYYKLAMNQQSEYGIPASITLAQGLLESQAGQSWLAVNSNNHFGIKCNNWQGDKVYQDDDTKNECFRKYDKVKDSYEDHSLFIKKRDRYSSLFELSKTDYESWAFGLKKAGYATDPTYAFKLISIIENYNLHKYDLIESKEDFITGENYNISQNTIGKINAYTSHKIFKNNHLRYVVATDNDTWVGIADEFNMDQNRLLRFNEATIDEVLNPGSKVYLETKRRGASRKFPLHEVKEGESMYSISQNYGIRLENLYKMNDMPYTSGAKVGQVLKLRK